MVDCLEELERLSERVITEWEKTALLNALWRHRSWLLTQAREAETLREDSARYRWLRQSVGNPAYPMQACEFGLRHITGDNLDAAIDSARKGEEG